MLHCRARSPGGDSRALLQAAAHLYQLQGRFDLALAILLRLQQPDTFDFVIKHGLLPLLRPSHVAALVRIDEVPDAVLLACLVIQAGRVICHCHALCIAMRHLPPLWHDISELGFATAGESHQAAG